MKKTNLVLSALALIMSAALVFTGCIHDPATQDPVTYTVTFDSNGGSAVSAVTVNEGDAVAEPTAPTKDGYTFAGWYNGEVAYDFAETVVADLTLKASWTATEYTIEYVLAEGEANADTNPTKYTIETEDITLAAPTGTVEKPNFVAWHTTAKPEEGDWGDAVTGVAIAKGSTGNKTFYAEFSKEKVYTVTFKASDDTKIPETRVVEGGKITVPTVKGKTIDGLYTDAEMTTAFDVATTISADTTIYVKLSVIKVTVTFDSDGGSEVVSASVEYGAKVTKPTDPTKEGFTFKGWKKGDADYDFDSEVKESITLKAVWEAKGDDIVVIELKEYPLTLLKDTYFNGLDITTFVDADKKLKTGDKFKVKLSGKADKEIKNLTVFILDNAKDTNGGDSYESVEISNKVVIAETIAAKTDFDYEIDLTVSKDQTGTGELGHRLRFTYDNADVNKKILIYEKGTEIVDADPSELWKGEVTVDWSAESGRISIPGSSFEDVTENSYIELTITKAPGQFKLPDQGSDKWSEVFTAGTATNAGLTDKKDAWWVNDAGIATYKPTAEEWEKIKKSGFLVFGDGLTITKICLKEAASAE